MVVRNEADRYLEKVLRWHRPFLDELLVYDEGSTDDSDVIAQDCGAFVTWRPHTVPSFRESETAVRQDAWNQLGALFTMTANDWVLSIDADEFFLAGDTRASALEALQILTDVPDEIGAYSFNVDEVFDQRHGQLMARHDGFWGGITADRMVRWHSAARFRVRQGMGCGSIPLGTCSVPRKVSPGVARIVHLGYLRPEDRQTKYERYSNDVGHSSRHVESILQTPQLEEVRFPWPALSE